MRVAGQLGSRWATARAWGVTSAAGAVAVGGIESIDGGQTIEAVGGSGRARPVRTNAAVAWAVVLGALAACAGAIAASHVDIPLGRWVVLTVITSVLGFVDVQVGTRVWVGPAFAFAILGLVYLGPAGVFSTLAVAEVSFWAIHRPRPFSVFANMIATGAFVLIGALVLKQFRSLTVQTPGLYVLLTVVGMADILWSPVILRFLHRLRFGQDQWASVKTISFVPPLVAMLMIAEVSVRVYADSEALGVVLLMVASALFVLCARLVRDARISARENAELAAARGVLLGQALEAEDRERRYVAQLLHDDAVQLLLAARQDLDEADTVGSDRAARAQARIDATIAQLRGAISELHPDLLTRLGLKAALSAVLEDQARGRFEWDVVVSPAADGTDDRLVFSLARELIANAARHAQPTMVRATVAREGETVTLSVVDDGVGFRADVGSQGHNGHIGLRSVIERARAGGGDVRIESAPGLGTVVTVRVGAEAGGSREVAPAASPQ